MSPTICGIGCILIGVFFIGLLLFGDIRDAQNGMKMLDGEIIAINHETQTLRIRYQIDKNQYHEIDYHQLQCFATGVFPKVGLKVGVKVFLDDPSSPVSILLQHNYTRGGRGGYINCSRFHTILRVSLLSGFFISAEYFFSFTRFHE